MNTEKKCECWIDDWMATQDANGQIETLRCTKCGRDLLEQKISQQRQSLYKEIKKIAGKHSTLWMHDKQTTMDKIHKLMEGNDGTEV